MAKCVNCLFARAIPRPEIKTINVTSIVGAIEQNLANDLYDSQMENHLHRIKCHRQVYNGRCSFGDVGRRDYCRN